MNNNPHSPEIAEEIRKALDDKQVIVSGASYRRMLRSLLEENDTLRQTNELIAQSRDSWKESHIQLQQENERITKEMEAWKESAKDQFSELFTLRSQLAEKDEGLAVYAHRGNWQEVISGRIQWAGVENEPWAIAQSILSQYVTINGSKETFHVCIDCGHNWPTGNGTECPACETMGDGERE